MNTDKNTVIGFILLAGLFFAYFWYNNKQQTELQAYNKRINDSTQLVKSLAEKAAAANNPIIADSASNAKVLIDSVQQQITTLENDLIKVIN
jgi:YidC/Oxa1 family membrane protein insertase